jgi:RNA polymerase sigma factor (sigma-70 family)
MEDRKKLNADRMAAYRAACDAPDEPQRKAAIERLYALCKPLLLFLAKQHRDSGIPKGYGYRALVTINDIVSEVFEAVLDTVGAEKKRCTKNFSSWLGTIAKHEFINLCRNRLGWKRGVAPAIKSRRPCLQVKGYCDSVKDGRHTEDCISLKRPPRNLTKHAADQQEFPKSPFSLNKTTRAPIGSLARKEELALDVLHRGLIEWSWAEPWSAIRIDSDLDELLLSEDEQKIIAFRDLIKRPHSYSPAEAKLILDDAEAQFRGVKAALTEKQREAIDAFNAAFIEDFERLMAGDIARAFGKAKTEARAAQIVGIAYDSLSERLDRARKRLRAEWRSLIEDGRTAGADRAAA